MLSSTKNLSPDSLAQSALPIVALENSNPKRVPVGSLRSKWQFPSDHLPIGVKVNDFLLVSWNVLNNAFIDWIADENKDTQGLYGSMITSLNVQVKPDGLTLRDQRVIEIVKAMIETSIDMIALQECSEAFLTGLQDSLPEGWKLVKKSDKVIKDEDIILYDSRLFSYRSDISEVAHCYFSSPKQTLLNAAFQTTDETHQIIRILNAHIPGNPNLPGKEEFAQYVFGQYTPLETLIALGDHNFEREEMINAYEKAGLPLSNFDFYSPWNTNIDPDIKESKCIDHFLIPRGISTLLPPDLIVNNYQLAETIALLSTRHIS